MGKEAKRYVIPVSYQVSGLVTVTAVSAEDAVEAAADYIDDLPLPSDTEYIDASYEVENDPDMVVSFTESYEAGNVNVTHSDIVSDKAKALMRKTGV